MEQVTTLFTSLTSGGAYLEQSEVGISSLMDTWMILRDIESSGERNRGIMILKSRGMAHSNQVREFLLTDNGIMLEDVYLGPAGVLTGAARTAQEAKEKMAEAEALGSYGAKAARDRAQAGPCGGADRGLAGGNGRRRRGDKKDRAGRTKPADSPYRPAGGYGPPAPGRCPMKDRPPDHGSAFEKVVNGSTEKKYVLRLYVAGTTARSNQAVTNIKRICEEHLKGRYLLEVIDIYQQPILAKGEQIIAAPTLIKKLPPPLRRFIGTMADEERILVGLDLKPREPEK